MTRAQLATSAAVALALLGGLWYAWLVASVTAPLDGLYTVLQVQP